MWPSTNFDLSFFQLCIRFSIGVFSEGINDPTYQDIVLFTVWAVFLKDIKVICAGPLNPSYSRQTSTPIHTHSLHYTITYLERKQEGKKTSLAVKGLQSLPSVGSIGFIQPPPDILTTTWSQCLLLSAIPLRMTFALLADSRIESNLSHTGCISLFSDVFHAATGHVWDHWPIVPSS